MKFSDIREDQWEELRPFLDTCVLPLSALSGKEQPVEVVRKLERLRDALDFVEIPFKGRIVTYPAVHFTKATGGDELKELVDGTSRNLKECGFAYVIAVTAEHHPGLAACSEVDLVIEPFADSERSSAEIQKEVRMQIQALWTREQETAEEVKTV